MKKYISHGHIIHLIILIILGMLIVQSIPASFIEHASSPPREKIKTVETTQDHYDYVIITPSFLEDAVRFLKNWKQIINYSVKIVNTSWIYQTYNGSDNQEKIRNFLIDNYETWGMQYVLLVGSHSEIPMRYCYNSYAADDNILTDFYYADLTGDWDSDNDGIYAEITDDSPDFYPEVLVGRIPINDTNMVSRICQKIIDFERDTGTWKKKALLLGAITNYKNEIGQGNPKTDTAALMEILQDEILSPAGFSCISMYEKGGLSPSIYDCDYPLTRENVSNFWQQGYGMVIWGSHGTSSTAHRKWWNTDNNRNNVPDIDEIQREDFIATPDAITLNNEHPSIVYSCACSNADPTDPDNLGQALLQNGAVAFIGATNYLHLYFGWDDISDGGSMTIAYYLIDYFVEEKQTIGEALHNSKFYCWNEDDIPNVYENMLVLCLYGDPSLSLDTYPSMSRPDIPDRPHGPQTIQPLIPYSYSTIAEDPQSNPIYYIWDWGDGNESGPIGPFESGEPVNMTHYWDTPGDFVVRVKSVSIIGDESSWSDPLIIHVKGPVVRIESITGGLFTINAVIANNGDIEARDISWKITLIGGSILLGRQSSGTITSLLAGETTTIASNLIYGIGIPTVIRVEITIPNSSSDMRVQSGNILLFIIRI